jgi:hypothetical protein
MIDIDALKESWSKFRSSKQYFISMKEEDISKISNEEWLAIKENVRVVAYQTAVMALVDLGDSESALNSLRPYMRLCGQAFTINMTKVFDIQGDDIDKIGDVCFLHSKVCDHDLREIERTEEKIVFVGGTKCHWQDNPREACMTGHEMLLNEVCQAINPEYECKFTQMVTKGDHMCSYVIEKKKK